MVGRLNPYGRIQSGDFADAEVDPYRHGQHQPTKGNSISYEFGSLTRIVPPIIYPSKQCIFTYLSPIMLAP